MDFISPTTDTSLFNRAIQRNGSLHIQIKAVLDIPKRKEHAKILRRFRQASKFRPLDSYSLALCFS